RQHPRASRRQGDVRRRVPVGPPPQQHRRVRGERLPPPGFVQVQLRPEARSEMKLACAIVVLGLAGRAVAQPSSGVPDETEPVVTEAQPQEGWGVYEPGFGRGFNVGETKLATLNISGYSLFRFINQLGNDTF